MGRGPAFIPSRQEKNTESASRVRDNKRRHRARQKEYILDLERRVADAREQGIHVTKEVQLAAQGVVRENAKLRDLLRRTGYTDNAIDAWVREDGCSHGEKRYQVVVESAPEKSVQKVASACGSQEERKLGACNSSVQEGEPVRMKASESEECLSNASPPVDSLSKKSEVAPTQVYAAACTKSSFPPQNPDSGEAPCKLLTLLAKNPAADITQIPISTQSDSQPCMTSKPENGSSDGVECSSAYKMLMQYATSDEKMDKIAAALEIGCTPSGTGGCKVKKSVVWTVLDEECT